jgi:flagellar biosynthetic protein FlhB
MAADNKTEKPTDKRRKDARKKGQIARRPELSATFSFLAGLFTVSIIGDQLLRISTYLFKSTFSIAVAEKPLTASGVHDVLISATASMAMLSLPVIASILIAGLVVNFSQGGLTLSAEALKPSGARFNPVANLKKVFGSNAPVEIIKNILKLAGIVGVCYGLFAKSIKIAPTLVGLGATQTFTAIGDSIYGLGLRAGGVLGAVALLDYGYGWYKHEKSLKMSKQEVRDEYKQQEGDPSAKGQRRRAARALMQRMVAVEVPRADVVITNPTHFAVALRYNRAKDPAPVVVAKGADLMAKRIREIAKANKVEIVESPPLARALYRAVRPGSVIPPELFRAVAEILAYVYRQRERT